MEAAVEGRQERGWARRSSGLTDGLRLCRGKQSAGDRKRGDDEQGTSL